MGDQRIERRLAAILAADVVGYSRLTGADEEGTLARLKAIRHELIDPAIARARGRIVKTTGDGILVEFLSVVEAVRCAQEVQLGMTRRNAGITPEKRIEFRVGINLGDIVVDGDDLLGDGVNIAARLEGFSEPGAICLSEDAYRHVNGKIVAEFVDLGEQNLKNIARPVRVYSIRPTSITPAGTRTTTAALPLPDKPSIAVLAFTNMSGDAEQDYFCDGMVEDIITGLSRINWLFVIARNSSFVYKGKAVDVKQIGRELGVRYVLEGSVRKSGNRVRITGQLIEAQTGAHVWADKYDGALEDIFDLQDKITASIVGIIEPNLRRAEIERAQRKRPDSLDAYDLYLRALPHLASVMPEDAKIGMDYLEEALKLDPHYTVAHAHLALALQTRVARGGFGESDVAAGVRHARAAVAYGSDDATALAGATVPLLHLGHDFAAASGAIARALSLNGSCADALFYGAHIHGISGDPALADDYAARALRLSPFDPLSFSAHGGRGHARLRAGKFDEASSCYLDAVQANPRFSMAYTLQTAALAMAGRLDEARSVARRLLELEPSFRMRPLVNYMSAFAAPEFASALAAGLTLVGLPE